MKATEYIKEIEEFTKKRAESENYNEEYLNFDIANKIREIPDKEIRIKVALYYIDQMKEVPSLTDLILKDASQEQIPKIVKIYQENGIYVDADEYKVDSIEMRIAEAAAEKFGKKSPRNLVEAKKITENSEIIAVRGIISVLNLNEEDEKYLLDDVYHQTEVSEYMASQIKGAISENKNEKILEILSTIHDGWVISNIDDFLKPGEEEERQFVPLEMLNWEEVESDLLFLQPILEGAGIEIDVEDLKKSFEKKQVEFFDKNDINSHQGLVNFLSTGSKFYPILEGRETINGGSIEELLKDPKIAKRMAKQIESKLSIYPEEEIKQEESNIEKEIESKEFNEIIVEEQTKVAVKNKDFDEIIFKLNKQEKNLENVSQDDKFNEIIYEDGKINLENKIEVPKHDGQNTKPTITPEEIARVDREAGLTKKETSLWGKIINKIKNIFKSRDDK